MPPNRSVLACVDGSEAADQAAQLAVRLAAGRNARVELIYVQTPHGEPDCAIDDVQDIADKLGVPLSIVRPRDIDPLVAILERASVTAPTAIAVGSRGNAAVRHLLLGSTTVGLLRQGTWPVLVCPGESATNDDGRFHRPLVPIDFSRDSADALQVARWLVAPNDGAIDALHVVDSRLAPPYFPETWREIKREDVRVHLRPFINDAIHGANVTERIEFGRPSDSICEHARARANDLIVMSRAGLDGISRFLLGSVTERVLGQAPCPVLVLPSHTPAAAATPAS